TTILRPGKPAYPPPSLRASASLLCPAQPPLAAVPARQRGASGGPRFVPHVHREHAEVPADLLDIHRCADGFLRLTHEEVCLKPGSVGTPHCFTLARRFRSADPPRVRRRVRA